MRLWLLLAALVTFLADFATKWLAIKHLQPYYPWEAVPIIPGYFDLRWRMNEGGAFSLFHDKPWIITTFASIAIVAIAIWGFKLPRKVTSAQIAIGMILGGAVGNLLDRIRFGYVVDFLHCFVMVDGKEHFWPTFNVADMGICFGIGIVLYLSLLTKKLDPETETPAPQSESPGTASAVENSAHS
jgi:signal peptidase II